MRKMYLMLPVLLCGVLGVKAQAPVIKWQNAVVTRTPYITQTTDGSLGDIINVSEAVLHMLPTTDGGYIALTRTSYIGTEFKLVKLTAAGDTVFAKRIGFITNTGGYSVWDMVEATDGGFVTVGSNSVAGVAQGAPIEELLSLRKYDENGLLVWEEDFRGGDFIDQNTKKLSAASVVAANDGGYVIAAGSNNLKGNDKTEDTKGNLDYWIIKTDVTGLAEWDKTIGGTGSDNPVSVVKAQDGGYVIAGYSNSPLSGDKSQNQQGDQYDNDFWVVKLDANGSKVWDKTIGSASNEYAKIFVSAPDGGFILAGDSHGGISGDKTEHNFVTDDWDSEDTDTWVLKLASTGNIEWQKSLGGRKTDAVAFGYLQADGSIILNITSNSPVSDNKNAPAQGQLLYDEPSDTYYYWEEPDYWVVKLSPVGSIVWQTSLGGLSMEAAGPVLAAQDGGVLVTGRSSSRGKDGNRTLPNKTFDDAIYAGGSDIWMVNLDETSLPVSLLSFTGRLQGNNKGLLEWETATEENFSHFELEKFINSQYYAKVARVPAKGKSSHYAYIDNIGNGINYYRLKMADKNGAVKYSGIVTINNTAYAAVTIAPNPVTSAAMLIMSMPTAPKNAFLQIIGIDGKVYGTQTVTTGATQVKIDTRVLIKGNYVLLYGHGGELESFRFIKN